MGNRMSQLWTRATPASCWVLQVWLIPLFFIPASTFAQNEAKGRTSNQKRNVQAFVAQYEGRSLGEGKLILTPLEKSSFEVKATGEIRHPHETNKVYKFSLQMHFKLEGRRISILRNVSRYNREAAEHRTAIEQLVPFLFLVAMTDPPDLVDPTERTYLAPNGYYVLRFLPTRHQIEGILHCDDVRLARFFLKPMEQNEVQLSHVKVSVMGDQEIDFLLGQRLPP